MSDKPETLEERKARRKAEVYGRKVKIPPRERPVEIELPSGDVEKYVLRRPSLGKRSKLFKKLGIMEAEKAEFDPDHWADIIEATLHEPSLSKEEIDDLDADVADILYLHGQEVIRSSVLTDDQEKSDSEGG